MNPLAPTPPTPDQPLGPIPPDMEPLAPLPPEDFAPIDPIKPDADAPAFTTPGGGYINPKYADPEEDGDTDAEVRPATTLAAPSEPTQSEEEAEEAAYREWNQATGGHAMAQMDRHVMLAVERAFQPKDGWTFARIPLQVFRDGRWHENNGQVLEYKARGWIERPLPPEYAMYVTPGEIVLQKATRAIDHENREAVALLEQRMNPHMLAAETSSKAGGVELKSLDFKPGEQRTFAEVAAELPESEEDLEFTPEQAALLRGEANQDE